MKVNVLKITQFRKWQEQQCSGVGLVSILTHTHTHTYTQPPHACLPALFILLCMTVGHFLFGVGTPLPRRNQTSTPHLPRWGANSLSTTVY